MEYKVGQEIYVYILNKTFIITFTYTYIYYNLKLLKGKNPIDK